MRRGGSELGLTFVARGTETVPLGPQSVPFAGRTEARRPLCGSLWRQSGWRLPFVGSAPAVHSELYESNLNTVLVILYERNPATELWHSKFVAKVVLKLR